MARALRERLQRALRVPDSPCVPAGAREVVVFRAAPNYYRYKLALWGLAQIGALAGLFFGLILLSRFGWTHPVARFSITAMEVLWWAGYLLQLPFSYLLVRMDFELRWYVLSDRSLRIREGIVRLREKTMTFANIQHIEIRQNPLQRLLGIADVQVRTAGGGASGESNGRGPGESAHEAWFRGVSNPEEIRDTVRDRVRLHRDAGLGDPDDPSPPPLPTADLLGSAHLLLTEVRRLRHHLVPRSSGSSLAEGGAVEPALPPPPL